MDDVIKQQWETIAQAIAVLSGIRWGSITLVYKDGKFTGLIETRSTMRTDEEEKE